MATVAVTGAGGKTGRAVVDALGGDWQVVGLARTAGQADRLRAGGHRAVVGDIADPQALRRLCAGADAVYHICPNFRDDEFEVARRVIDAASTVERFVYHSVIHPQTRAMPHHWRKLAVEELLLARRPGATTFLRPAPYVQNLASYLAEALDTGELVLPYAVDTPTAMVDLVDVGRAAVTVLADGFEHGSGWDLAGVAAVSHREIADRLSRLSGRPVAARSAHVVDHQSDLGAMFAYMHAHGLAASTGQLRALIGEPTPLDVSLTRLLAEHLAVRS